MILIGQLPVTIALQGRETDCSCVYFAGFTVSVYDVTSRSVYLQWPKFPGAFSYRAMATPLNTVGHSSSARFSDVTLVGALASLAPNTIHTVKVDAIDKNGVILAEAQTMQLTG